MPEIAQARTNTIVPGLDLKKIRKTDETPPRVSVYDLIGVVSKVENPRKTWQDLRTGHPETVTESYSYKADHKFLGRGNQTTPVINARGAIMIINLLPGSMAASFRGAWADIIVRYLGGDRTLIDEVEANHAYQQQLPDTDPMRFFGQTVERDGVIRRLKTGDYPKEAFTVAMTNQSIVQSGEVDLTAPQGYLGVAENVKVPPGIVPPGGIVGHFGCTHNEPTQRLMAHNGKFGLFRFIRHYPCANAYGLEQKWKAFLQIKGRIVPVLRADGNVDYESFWVHDLQEWMKFENEFQKMCDKLVDFICRTEEKRLDLKIKEAEIAISVNQIQISANEARRAEAEARQAVARAQVRLAELQYSGQVFGLETDQFQTVTEIGTETEPELTVSDGPKPERETDTSLNVDANEDPYKEFRERFVEREADLNIPLAWNDLKRAFVSWYNADGRNMKKISLERTPIQYKDYFKEKMPGFLKTTHGDVQIDGWFGWKLRHDSA